MDTNPERLGGPREVEGRELPIQPRAPVADHTPSGVTRSQDFDRQIFLSVRQRQIVTLIALGFSNDEIAARLGISPRTARAHCDVVRFKLGARRRRDIPRLYCALTGEDPLGSALRAQM